MIDWEKKYQLGIKEIDKQHKKFFTLAKKVYNLANDKSSKKTIDKAVVDLINYAKEHFSEEEKSMEINKYPMLEQQKNAHRKFIEKVCNYQKNIMIGDLVTTTSIFNFSWDWLSQHILKMDKKYKEFLDK